MGKLALFNFALILFYSMFTKNWITMLAGKRSEGHACG
jgi:hypothetical protein